MTNGIQTEILVKFSREGAPAISARFYVRDSVDSITKKVNQVMYAFEDCVTPVNQAAWMYTDGRKKGGPFIISR